MHKNKKLPLLLLALALFHAYALGISVPSESEVSAYCAGLPSPEMEHWMAHAPSNHRGWDNLLDTAIEYYRLQTHATDFVALPVRGTGRRARLLKKLFSRSSDAEGKFDLADKALRFEVEPTVRSAASEYLRNSNQTEAWMIHAEAMVHDRNRAVRERIQILREMMASQTAGSGASPVLVRDWISGDSVLEQAWALVGESREGFGENRDYSTQPDAYDCGEAFRRLF